MRSLGLIVLLVLVLPVTIFAQQDTPREVKAKHAWEWTDEERIAKRYDPTDIVERRVAVVRCGPKRGCPRSRCRIQLWSLAIRIQSFSFPLSYLIT